MLHRTGSRKLHTAKKLTPQYNNNTNEELKDETIVYANGAEKVNRQ
jgi:hypothetical protein